MIVSFVVAAALAAQSPPPCAFEGEPVAWTRQALENWDRLDRERIRIERPTTPAMVLFDASCAYRLTPDPSGLFAVGARRYSASAEAHSGEIALPNGGAVPARKLSFAAPTPDGGMFFVMGLPALWRADTAEARDPDTLAMVVFMHEFAHTQQGDGLGVRIDRMIAAGLPEDANDDSIQTLYGPLPGHTEAWEAERDAFYDAASAPDDNAVRRVLGSAASFMAERRATYLGSEHPAWTTADDVFLTLEGSGNWAGWQWLVHADGAAMDPDEATAFMRGARRWWSQDEGLGVMLALDRLTPDWPTLTFRRDPATVNDLIARALQAPRSSE